MKKMIDYPLFHDPVEITHALITVASQENCDGPDYDLMMEAADRIRVLEAMLSIYLKNSSDCFEDREMYLDDWKEWAKHQKALSPEFIKIVEENFWELLA